MLSNMAGVESGEDIGIDNLGYQFLSIYLHFR